MIVTAGAIRLLSRDRANGSAGLLQMYHVSRSGSLWVSICAPDGIDQAAADVACRQIGYEKAYDYGGATSLG